MIKGASIRVCIVCFKGDAHADIVASILINKYSATVDFIHPELTPSVVSLEYDGGKYNNFNDYDVIWLRRKNTLHSTKNIYASADLFINVAQSNHDAFHEFLNLKREICINDPINALLIENKATQLRIAIDSGLKVAPTIISNDYQKIKTFNSRHRPLVIKNMRSLGGEPTGTFELNDQFLTDENCRASYAIYQKMISGNSHYRILVFGDRIFPFVYSSKKVDSRFDARTGAKLTELDLKTNNCLLDFMINAGLKMGVFDFKRSDEGDFYFLEVNQQGSFAYLDPLTGTPVMKEFADFIYREGKRR